MFKKSYVRCAIAAGIAVGAFGTQSALAADEMELNDQISRAQVIDVRSGSVVVNGSIGVTAPTQKAIYDVDFYAFTAHDGDVVTIDIDGGWKIGTTTERSVDTVIALYGPDLRKIADGDNTLEPFDEGTVAKWDAYIDKYKLNKGDGTYYVAVTSWASGRAFRDGGVVASNVNRDPGTNGRYSLAISFAASVQVINIDIRPGSTDLAPFNPKSKGNMPVALLSSAATPSSPAFDALGVDRDSLTFGATGTEKSLKRCNKEGTDVNGDGLLDLVCHFDNTLVNFDVDHSMGKVMGKTGAGQQFEGTGMLKVVPMRKE